MKLAHFLKRTSSLLLVLLSALAVDAAFSGHAAAAEKVELSTLNLGLDTSAWALPKANKSASGQPLSVRKKVYEKGLGTRAGSSYFVALGGSERLTAEVGVDDQTDEGAFRQAQFQVLADDQVLFDSGHVQAGTKPMKVGVDVKGRKVLELRVIDHAAGLAPAYVDWIDAILLVDGEKPKAISHPEPAEILTPAPGPEPRINGAKVFGVRPGSPFLFTIAATGERPLTFSAENLPEGLAVNAQTGVISGTIASKKEVVHIATLHAKNGRGEASRDLRIVVGPRIMLTPPLGFNSWNSYARMVDQEKIMATARAFVGKGLKDHGWTYVNIDDTWQGARGGPFQAIQGNEKFPDMKGMCDQIHAMGLKVGIYSTPWMTSYAGFIGGSSNDKSGAWTKDTKKEFGKYSFATSDAKQWAAWGIDYLKYDWRPLDIPHVQEMAEALTASGRDIVYSLSNTALYDHAAQYARLSNCWRTTGDIRDVWDLGDRSGQKYPQGIVDIMSYNTQWQPFSWKGHYNDPDMLVVGKVGWGALRPTHLTPNEQYTHISLWCLWSAPLLIGAPVDQLDDFTLNLLSNDEVLAVNQDPTCFQAQRVAKYGPMEVWTKPLEDGSLAVGIFNLGFEEAPFTLKWADLELDGPRQVRNLWRQKDLGSHNGSFDTRVARHGVVMLRLSASTTSEHGN